MSKRGGKNKKEGFNTSIPDLIEQVNATLELFCSSPALPTPWPPYVPTLEHMHRQICDLETSFKAVDGVPKPGINMVSMVMKARRELKTSLSQLLRYVAQTVADDQHAAKWLGFNQRRVPIEKGSRHRSKRAGRREM